MIYNIIVIIIITVKWKENGERLCEFSSRLDGVPTCGASTFCLGMHITM